MKNFNVYAYVLCGIPGSGKSTWVEKNCHGLPVISRDIIRAELGFTNSSDEKVVLDYNKELEVTKKEYESIFMLCESNQSFVIDDTNINPYFRKEMLEYLKKNGVIIIGVNIDTPIEICINRRKVQILEENMMMIFKRQTKIKEDEVDYLINEKGY